VNDRNIFRALARPAPYLLLVLLLAVSFCRAQSVEAGRISGVVQDGSGGVIRNAVVSIRNLATGLADSVVTNADGLFVSQPLQPADYEVNVEFVGFAKLTEKVHLEVAQRSSLTLVLTPGKTTQEVTVEAAAPLLSTESSTLSNVRTETAVADLPLNGRNFAELMSLSAGVVSAQQQAASVPLTALRGMTSYSTNGNRPEENNYLLDGISDTENHNGGGIALFPPLDAVQEFREETSVPDARFGRGGGGSVNLVFKSGTDKLHGDVFEFLRNSDLDARNFFDKSKPAFHMNQFGATLGGPLGRKQPRTFFFVDYQGTRIGQGLTYVNTVPTAAERMGDFSGVSTPIYDPNTTVESASGTYSRSAFPGNKIPASEISTVGSNLINLYPLANLSGTANNYLYNPLRTDNGDEFDVKIDRRFSNDDNAFLRYSQARDAIYQPGTLPKPAVGGGISGLSEEPSRQVVLSENHVFSPTIVNTARAGFTRVAITSTDANAGQALATEVGIPGSNVAGNPLTDGLPRIPITGATALGSYGNLPAIIVSNNFQYDDSVSLVWGRHTVQIGGETQRRQYNVFQTANLRGTLNFTTAYSSSLGSGTSGLGLADLLLGTPVSGSLQFLDGMRGLRQTEFAGFIQDDFHVSGKLTLNAGLRYENYLGWPWTEVDNRMFTFVGGANGVEQVGTNGIPRSGVYPNNLDFMPRLGLAYQVLPKTVFRAAYGIFYSAPQIPIANDATANPPEMVSTAFSNSQYDFVDARTAAQGLSHPSTGTVAGSALYVVDPYAHQPYTQQWNTTIQHQITQSTLFTVAYVGTKGTHLLSSNDINQPVPGTTALASRRPYPLYQSIIQSADVSTSSYNALQATLERRLSHNLSYQLAYTWSHSLDYQSLNPGTGGAAFLDSYDHRLDYGNSDDNSPQRFVASFVYKLPFHTSGFARHVVDGWEFNGILTLSDGIPFSVYSASNTLNNGVTSRAELIGPGNGSLSSSQRSIAEWFNTAAFSTPPTLAWGDAGRNTIPGPATKQLDYSLFKNFSIAESRSLQLRAEAFNLFNTPQFNNPAATIGAAGAGTVTSAGSPFTFQRLSREVQLAAKFYF